MAGPNELELRKALSSDPGQIHQAAAAWRSTAEALGQVADELLSTRSEIEASWTGGSDADAATMAFDQMSQQVRKRARDMSEGATALDTAAGALSGAKRDYANLPGVPSAPAPLGGDATPRQEVAHQRAASQHDQAVAAREAAAARAVHQMNAELGQAQGEMGTAVPYRDSHGGGGGGGNQSGGATGGTGPVAGGGAAPVGPYSTSTSGTHAGSSPHGAGAVLVGTPVLGGVVAVTGGGGPGRNDQGTPDGVVAGEVPAPGATPNVAAPSVLAGATGGVAGSSSVLGVTAGGVAGSGAALGVTGGGAAAILGGGRGIVSTARTAAGGSGSAVEGEAVTARPTAGDSRSLVGGRPGALAEESVLGGRAGAVGEQSVLGGRPGALAEETVLGGRPVGAAGTGVPRTGMAGVAGGAEEPGQAGSRAVTGGQSAAGGSGARRSSALSGQRSGGPEDEADRRKGMIMAEDWIDEEDVAPDVIE